MYRRPTKANAASAATYVTPIEPITRRLSSNRTRKRWPRRKLLAQHDQGIGAVGHPAPLRVVVGLELPDVALGRQQQHLAMVEPPSGRRERCYRRIAFRLEEYLEIVLAGLGVGQRDTADHHAIAAHHRPVADHLIHRFRPRQPR